MAMQDRARWVKVEREDRTSVLNVSSAAPEFEAAIRQQPENDSATPRR